jgi:hypothetical protein
MTPPTQDQVMAPILAMTLTLATTMVQELAEMLTTQLMAVAVVQVMVLPTL